MSRQLTILRIGAGGCLGPCPGSYLPSQGYWVRRVDVTLPDLGLTAAEECVLDLRYWRHCLWATRGMDDVYALAAEPGGKGYASSHHGSTLHTNALINLHTREAARTNGISCDVLASSLCVYPAYRQTGIGVIPPHEEDAYLVQPQDVYGWEKSLSTRLCLSSAAVYGTQTHSARLHSIFGPPYAWMAGQMRARQQDGTLSHIVERPLLRVVGSTV